MKCRSLLVIVALASMLLLAVASLPGPGSAYGQNPGTRSGDVGWQYDTFTQNLDVEVTPEEPTTMDPITITITSRLEEVWIRQATVYGTVYPVDGVQFPFSFPFQKKSNTVFECIIEPFPLNGYRVEFYIFAYDHFYSPLDSRDSLSFSYDVVGSGWRHDTFDENIELEYWPLRANATEEVNIIIRSPDNITISGANLYIIYETLEGDLREGGWNFTKTDVESTEMRQNIPGYPAGTNVTFWVTAWDQYNAVITSRMYNYSVMGIAEYTDFPFEYTDETGDRNMWNPDDRILLSMAGMSALGIPLFIYLHTMSLGRRRRTDSLVKDKRKDNTEVREDE